MLRFLVNLRFDVNLKSLTLDNNNLNAEALAVLVESLRQNTSLEELYLAGNVIPFNPDACSILGDLVAAGSSMRVLVLPDMEIANAEDDMFETDNAMVTLKGDSKEFESEDEKDEELHRPSTAMSTRSTVSISSVLTEAMCPATMGEKCLYVAGVCTVCGDAMDANPLVPLPNSPKGNSSDDSDDGMDEYNDLSALNIRADSRMSYCPGTLGGKHQLINGVCPSCGATAEQITVTPSRPSSGINKGRPFSSLEKLDEVDGSAGGESAERIAAIERSRRDVFVREVCRGFASVKPSLLKLDLGKTMTSGVSLDQRRKMLTSLQQNEQCRLSLVTSSGKELGNDLQVSARASEKDKMAERQDIDIIANAFASIFCVNRLKL